MNHQNNNNLVVSYFLLLFAPLFAAITVIKYQTWVKRKWFLIMLITLWGSTIQLPADADASRFIKYIYDHYIFLQFDDFLYELYRIIIFNPVEGTKGDVFIHFLSYFTGAILGAPELLFVLVSFTYGYFYINALEKILNWSPHVQKNWVFYASVLLLITYRGVDNLQTIRTWTGFWVLFNGVLGYYQTNKIKYLFLMFAAPLFHAAYFAMALPAYIVIFIKRLTSLFFIGFYVSSFFISVDPGGVLSNLEKTELGSTKVKAYYISEDDARFGVARGRSDNSLYAEYGKKKVLHWAPHYLAFALILGGFYNKKKMNKLEFGLFSTGLLMASFANYGSFIEAYHSRTMINAGYYIVVCFTMLLFSNRLQDPILKVNKWSFKILYITAFVIFIPHWIYVLAAMIQYTSVFMIFFPFLEWFQEYNSSIREFIKQILGI